MEVFRSGGVEYDVSALWASCAGNPVEEQDIELYSASLEEECWAGIRDSPVSPSTVLRLPDLFPEHWGRIQNADLTYPILVAADGVVVDGRHRLCRLRLQGATRVAVRAVSAEQMAAAQVEDPR